MGSSCDLKALAAYLPVVGPLIGAIPGDEEVEQKQEYAFNAAIGSVLTLVTAVAMAALGCLKVALGLLALGGVSLIYHIINYPSDAEESAAAKKAHEFYMGIDNLPVEDPDESFSDLGIENSAPQIANEESKLDASDQFPSNKRISADSDFYADVDHSALTLDELLSRSGAQDSGDEG